MKKDVALGSEPWQGYLRSDEPAKEETKMLTINIDKMIQDADQAGKIAISKLLLDLAKLAAGNDEEALTLKSGEAMIAFIDAVNAR